MLVKIGGRYDVTGSTRIQGRVGTCHPTPIVSENEDNIRGFCSERIETEESQVEDCEHRAGLRGPEKTPDHFENLWSVE